MRFKRIFTRILAGLFLVVTALLALNFGLNFYLGRSADSTSQINSLRADLDLPAIDFSFSTDISSLVPKVNLFRQLMTETGNIPNYQAQKQAIIQAFQATVQKYFQAIQAYKGVDVSFIPTSAEIAAVSFTTAKLPATYLTPFKQKFREAIVTYNQSHTPLRWDMDVEAELAKMSLQQKLDQMFVFGISGTNLQAADKTFLQKYQPGGIVLLGNNISNQLLTFTNAIQATNPSYVVGVLTDQEGGTVKRIAADPTGSPKDIAKLSSDAACSAYQTRAKLLASLGINWNLGIVADVTADPNSFIYNRVYGSDYQTVANLVTQAVTCTTETLTTLKHFPGHGATNLNSHLVVPVINLDQKTWESTHLLPFAAGMTADADSVMLGQLKLTALDADNPATLSSKVIQYIRQTLKYDGILISDDMTMLETAGYSWQDALTRALSAGDDVLLYSNIGTRRDQILDYALNLANSGKLTASEIDTHVRRILTAKNKVLPTGTIPSELIY